MLDYLIEKIQFVINKFLRFVYKYTFTYKYHYTSIHNWQVWEDSDNIHS